MAELPGPNTFSSVPLFPLPNTVLFPGAILPLHIFEERYKIMTAEAIRGPSLVAMALLKPGWERDYHGRPPIEPVVCVGTIISHEKLPSGEYNFLLRGHARAVVISEIGQPADRYARGAAQQDARAVVISEIGQQAYRLGALSPLVETPAAESDMVQERDRLGALLEHACRSQWPGASAFQKMLVEGAPLAEVIDLISYYFLEGVTLKQSLLAEPNINCRIRRALQAMEQMVSAISAPRTRHPEKPNLN